MHSIRFCVGQERGICLKAPRIAGLMEGPNSHDVWRGINPLTKVRQMIPMYFNLCLPKEVLDEKLHKTDILNHKKIHSITYVITLLLVIIK